MQNQLLAELLKDHEKKLDSIDLEINNLNQQKLAISGTIYEIERAIAKADKGSEATQSGDDFALKWKDSQLLFLKENGCAVPDKSIYKEYSENGKKGTVECEFYCSWEQAKFLRDLEDCNIRFLNMEARSSGTMKVTNKTICPLGSNVESGRNHIACMVGYRLKPEE